jgi:hypothetical protein
MREGDMRERIQNFLWATTRNVVMPATMTMGLALAGCDSANKYASPMPHDASVADAPIQFDGSPMADARRVDGSPQSDAPIDAMYMGRMPDAGLDGADGVDASSINPTPKYMAVQPDAAVDAAAKDASAMRYAAQMPSEV